MSNVYGVVVFLFIKMNLYRCIVRCVNDKANNFRIIELLRLMDEPRSKFYNKETKPFI